MPNGFLNVPGREVPSEELAGTGTPLFLSSALAAFRTPIVMIPIPDNTKFVKVFDPSIFGDIVSRPTKVVVVDQDPAPGDFVPAGSPIKVTTTVKDVIPVGSFKGLSDIVLEKFDLVGDIITKVDATEAREVLVKDTKFEDLSGGDKQKLDGLFGEVFEDPGAVDNATKAKVYEDLKFIYGF
jgi:hypothetical protein